MKMEEERNFSVAPTYFELGETEEKEKLYKHDNNTRTIAISIVFVVTVIGNGLVLIWLFVHRRERTRIHVYMTFLALADLSVAMIPLLVSLIMDQQLSVFQSLLQFSQGRGEEKEEKK